MNTPKTYPKKNNPDNTIIADIGDGQIKKRLDFYLEMTKKEIKARYKHTVLGFLWMILNPLLQTIIIGVVFQHFIKTEVKSYFLFLIPGLLSWNFISYSINKATPAFVYERNLIQKAKFPREAIPLSIVFSNFFHLIVSFAFIALPIFLLVEGSIKPLNLLFVSLSLLWMLILTSSLSLITSCLNVRYRDVGFLTQAIVLVWFYVSPVMYSISLVPENLRRYYLYNPIAFPLEQLRNSLLGTAVPSEQLLCVNFALSFMLAVIGFFIYQKTNSTFSDWL